MADTDHLTIVDSDVDKNDIVQENTPTVSSAKKVTLSSSRGLSELYFNTVLTLFIESEGENHTV